MKTIISSDSLRRVLRTVAKASPARPALEILGCFRLIQKGSTLTVEATDGTALLRSTAATGEGCEDGAACVAVRFLLPFSQTLPPGDVTLETHADRMDCTWRTGDSVLPVLPAGDFPDVTDAGGDPCVEIPSGTLLAFLSKTIDQTEASGRRPVLGGILFDTSAPEGFSMVSSDGKGMMLVTAPGCTGRAEPFILSRGHAAVLKGILDSSDATLRLHSDGRRVRMECGDTTMVFPAVNGKYPNYRSIIPKDNDCVLTADTRTLLETVRRTGTFAERSADRILLRISGGRLTVEASDFSNSLSARDAMDVGWTSEDMSISFNMSCFEKVIGSFESPRVEIRIKDAVRPALVLPLYDGEGKAPANRMTGMIAAIR